MHASFKWIVAGFVALVVLPAQASAANAPVPSECQQPNLSPQAQARCDFIANTPDLCQRSGLSQATQQFCDQQAAAPALPKECQQPNLSPQAQARCDFIANTPNLCERSDLSKETQLFCDQQRFADVPLYNVVRVAANGAVRSIHLIETATGREVYTAYPYGMAFAVPAPRDRELRMKVEDLKPFLDGRPTPAAEEPAATGFATGLPIGWNDSTGVAPGQCFNYTIASPSNQTEQASFSSEDTASSTAEQTNVSATLTTSVDLFATKEKASFSDQWQSSSNSGNQYYNFYSLLTLDSTVSAAAPLNSQGKGAGGSFATLCGTQYMSSVPVGMVATISINYGSSSASTQTNVSASFKTSFGLDSVTTAVTTATSNSNTSSYFNFTMVSEGGGTDAADDLNNAFAMTNCTDGAGTAVACYAACGGTGGNPPDPDACETFNSNMGKGATEALDSFNGLVGGLSSASNPDLSFFETFPNGVAGATTTDLVTTAIPHAPNDVLAPYKSNLDQYVTLLNQIATLNNRAGNLDSLLDGSGFNPTSLDLLGYLRDLEDAYTTDRGTLLGNLETCLAATTSNVTSVCAPIIGDQVSDAFEYYATSPSSCASATPSTCFLAQENTLTLQYTGTSGGTDGTPLDVIYIDTLPDFSEPIDGQAAFVGFLDRPTTQSSAGEQPSVPILALIPNEPLSTDNVSQTVRQNSSDPSPFTLWFIGFGGDLLNFPDTTLSGVSCTPTFAVPCAIDYIEEGGFGYEYLQIEGLF